MVFCLILSSALISGMDIDSLTAALHVETGMAYIAQGLPEKAMSEFYSALEESDAAWEAHLGLARAAAVNSIWDIAEEEYITYMELCPYDHRAPLEMAEMLLGLPARHEDAVEFAEKALSLAPLDGQCWMTMAEAEASRGRINEALIWYARTISECDEYSMQARIGMGSLLYDQGDLSEAREILLPAASAGMAEAHRLLALVYLDQNDDLRARDSAARYLFLDPEGYWADSAAVYLERLSFESAPGAGE